MDDLVDTLILLERLFELEGHRTRIARSGAEALVVLNDFTPDVIVLDLEMPGMGGLDFLERSASGRGASGPGSSSTRPTRRSWTPDGS